MIQVFNKGNTILKAYQTTFLRYKMTTSYLEVFLQRYGIKYPPDWIGLWLNMLLFLLILIGVSAENPLIMDTLECINIYYVGSGLVFLIVISTILINLHISPNINRLLKIIPLHPVKISIIKIYVRLFDYKIYSLLFLAILIPVFNYYYNFPNSIFNLFKTYSILFLFYMNGCLLSGIINGFAFDKISQIKFNKINLFGTIILLFFFLVYKQFESRFSIANASIQSINLAFFLLIADLILFLLLVTIDLKK